MASGNLEFYSKKTGLQVKFMPPKLKEINGRRFAEKKGGILIEMAFGENKNFDWENKLNFAILSEDLPHLYEALYNWEQTGKLELKITHDPNANTEKQGENVKILNLANGKNPGTFVIGIVDNQGNKRYHYLRMGDFLLLKRLFESAPPFYLGYGKVI